MSKVKGLKKNYKKIHKDCKKLAFFPMKVPCQLTRAIEDDGSPKSKIDAEVHGCFCGSCCCPLLVLSTIFTGSLAFLLALGTAVPYPVLLAGAHTYDKGSSCLRRQDSEADIALAEQEAEIFEMDDGASLHMA